MATDKIADNFDKQGAPLWIDRIIQDNPQWSLFSRPSGYDINNPYSGLDGTNCLQGVITVDKKPPLYNGSKWNPFNAQTSGLAWYIASKNGSKNVTSKQIQDMTEKIDDPNNKALRDEFIDFFKKGGFPPKPKTNPATQTKPSGNTTTQTAKEVKDNTASVAVNCGGSGTTYPKMNFDATTPISDGEAWDNAVKIMDALINAGKGITAEVAAGIVGNMKLESGWNPSSLVIDTNGKYSGGLCQWNGPRLDKLNAFAGGTGKASESNAWKNVDAQVKYLLREFEGSEKKAYNAIIQEKSPGKAAYIFCKEFERPAQCSEKRVAYANSVYKKYKELKK